MQSHRKTLTYLLTCVFLFYMLMITTQQVTYYLPIYNTAKYTTNLEEIYNLLNL